jgi:hypothetical protein
MVLFIFYQKTNDLKNIAYIAYSQKYCLFSKYCLGIGMGMKVGMKLDIAQKITSFDKILKRFFWIGRIFRDTYQKLVIFWQFVILQDFCQELRPERP